MAGKKGRKIYSTLRWQLLRSIVKRRDGFRCLVCGKLGGALEVDHIKPVASGGSEFALSNVQLLCRGCHIQKSRSERLRSSPRTFDQQRKEWQEYVNRF